MLKDGPGEAVSTEFSNVLLIRKFSVTEWKQASIQLIFLLIPVFSLCFLLWMYIFLILMSVFLFLNSQLSVSGDSFNFGKVPFLITEWTYAPRFQPTLDAIKMKDVTTISKGNG